MNSTNWTRHTKSCQKKKAVKRTVSSISDYFKRTQCKGKFQKFEQSRK